MFQKAFTKTDINDSGLHLSWKERVDVIRSNRWFLTLFPFIILFLMVVFFGAATEGNFFKLRVLKGVVNQAIIIGTCATGVSFIYSNGNIDISIGAILKLAGTIGVLAYGATESIPVFIAVCVGVSVALMVFNCTLSAVFHIMTITAAIVMMQIYSAVSILIIGGSGRREISYGVSQLLKDGGFRFAAFLGYFVICVIIYHGTRVGRELRFIGGNAACARQTGMSERRATYISFLIAGLGIGLASIFSVIDVSVVTTETGGSLGMDVMLATVLGGMSIFGGSRSNAYAGMIGALTVSALNKGLLMMGVSSALIQGIRGVIFIILVYLNSEKQRLLPSRVQF